MTTVFISYRQEDAGHMNRVRELAERLQAAGVGVVLDQFLREQQPAGPDGWLRWSEQQVAWVAKKDRPPGAPDRILIVCSPGWFTCYENENQHPEKGIGAAWEARAIRPLLALGKGRADSLVRLACFGDYPQHSIPLTLWDIPRLDVQNPDKFSDLVSWLGGPAPRLQRWPEVAQPLEPWEIADAEEVRTACAAMLTEEPPQRILRVEAPGGSGKSTVTHALYVCAGKHRKWLRVGRLDLKGGTTLGLELERFARDVKYKDFAKRRHEFGERGVLSMIFDSLEEFKEPTLLIFDSFEQGGDFQAWVSGIALPTAACADWLRIVTTGREVPLPASEEWGQFAGAPVCLKSDVTAVAPAARGDAGQVALAGLDAACASLPESDRAGLRSALVAAAVPHWCDAAFLAALLDEPWRARAAEFFTTLRGLPGFEPFPARGEDACYVADAVRRALRRRLLREEPERLREWSARAAAFLADDESRTVRIEQIYHRLVAEGDGAADDAEAFDAEFWYGFGAGDHPVYAAALRELAEEGSITGRALVEALLSAGFSASKRGRHEDALALAMRARDVAGKAAAGALGEGAEAIAACRWGEARSHCIEGEVLASRDDPRAAALAYGRYAAMMREVVAAAPGRWQFQRELGVAESRVGNSAEVLREWEGALAAYRTSTAIAEALLAERPEDDRRRRSLAISRMSEGCVLMQKGGAGLDAAIEAFRAMVATARELTAKDPSNLLWLGDLCSGLLQLGDALAYKNGALGEAMKDYRECLAAAERWQQLDPVPRVADAEGAARSEAASYMESARGRILSNLLQQGRVADAQQICDAHFAACAKAAALAPRNPGRRFVLGVAHYYAGELHRVRGNLAVALASFNEARRLYEELLAEQPAMVVWRQELARALGLIGECHRQEGATAAARAAYEAQRDTAEKLLRAEPEHHETLRHLMAVSQNLGDLANERADLPAMFRFYRESREHAETLSAAGDGNAVVQAELARALQREALALYQTNDILGALAAMQRARELLRGLAEADPANIGLQSELAGAHLQMADLLERRGDLAPGAEERRRAAEIYNRLARAFEREGLSTGNEIGAGEQAALLTVRAGNLAEGIERFRAVLAAAEQYRAGHPGNVSARNKVAQLHYQLGDLLVRQGAAAECEEHLRQAAAIWQSLLERDPDNAGWLYSKAQVTARLADAAALRQDFGGARAAFAPAIVRMARCVELTPANHQWRRDLLIMHYRYAVILHQAGESDHALRELAECQRHIALLDGVPGLDAQFTADCIEIARTTGDIHFRLAHWKEAGAAFDDAIERARVPGEKPVDAAGDFRLRGLEKRLGDVRLAQGSHREAAELYAEYQSLCEEHLRTHPDDAATRRELARVLSSLGVAARGAGDAEGALQFHRDALNIMEALVALHPAMKDWQSDLANEHNHLAILFAARGERDAAIEHTEFAISLTEYLSAAAPGVALWQSNLAVLRANLGIFLAEPPRA